MRYVSTPIVSAVLVGAGSTLAAGCGFFDAPGDPVDSMEPDAGPATREPAQFPPSDPGYLEIRPRVLYLTPDASAQLTASVQTLGGERMETAASWTSGDPAVATVADDGTVTAGDVGSVDVTAAAGGRERVAQVVVTDSPPDGAVSIAFDRPFIQVQPDVETSVSYTLLNAVGEPIAESASVQAQGSGEIELALRTTPQAGGGTMALTAQGEGTVRVSARLEGADAPLAGALTVLSRTGEIASSGAACGDTEGSEWHIAGCWLPRVPSVMSVPGLTHILRLELVEERSCGTNFHRRVRQVAPSKVVLGNPDVLDIDGAGALVGQEPGWSGVGIYYDGFPCECPSVRVLADAEGTWSGECDNGDQGTVTVPWWPETIQYTYPGAYAPGTQTGRYDLLNATKTAADPNGTSCFVNSEDDFQCEDTGAVHPLFGVRECPQVMTTQMKREWKPSGNACSETPCDGSLLDFCARSRSNPSTAGSLNPTSGVILGPDTLQFASCTFERGGSDACEGGGPGGDMDMGQLTVDGTEWTIRSPADPRDNDGADGVVRSRYVTDIETGETSDLGPEITLFPPDDRGPLLTLPDEELTRATVEMGFRDYRDQGYEGPGTYKIGVWDVADQPDVYGQLWFESSDQTYGMEEFRDACGFATSGTLVIETQTSERIEGTFSASNMLPGHCLPLSDNFDRCGCEGLPDGSDELIACFCDNIRKEAVEISGSFSNIAPF